MSHIVQLIQIVEAVLEAQQRIPPEYGHLTYFSVTDLWLFHAVMDDVVCPECEAYDGHTYKGFRLRGLLPYLEIEDENRIKAHVHPNCRCWLQRSIHEKTEK